MGEFSYSSSPVNLSAISRWLLALDSYLQMIDILQSISMWRQLQIFSRFEQIFLRFIAQIFVNVGLLATLVRSAPIIALYVLAIDDSIALIDSTIMRFKSWVYCRHGYSTDNHFTHY